MALDAVVIMRFPSDVKAALQRAARAEDRSMSNLALAVLREWLVEHGHLPESRPERKPPRRRG